MGAIRGYFEPVKITSGKRLFARAWLLKIAAKHFSALGTAQGPPREQADAIGNEPNTAVAERGVYSGGKTGTLLISFVENN
jgi:hypothetical protein